MTSKKLTRFGAVWVAGMLAMGTAFAQQQPGLQEREQRQQPGLEQRERELQKQEHKELQGRDRTVQGEVSEEKLKKEVTKINRSSQVVGMEVRNLDDERLATINDLVFDFESGRISYAVLSVGGFLGIGDKLVAVPFEAFKPAPGEEHLLLNVSKERLEGAPGFAQGQYPSLDTRAWGAEGGWGELAEGKSMVRGEVKSLDVEQGLLVIQGQQGRDVEFKIHQNTYLQGPGQQRMQLNQLQEGQIVMVHFEEKDGEMIAQRIIYQPGQGQQERLQQQRPGGFQQNQPDRR